MKPWPVKPWPVKPWLLTFSLISAIFLSASKAAGFNAPGIDLQSLKIERVEVLIAASSTSAFESAFGHAALLLIPEGKTWKEAYVISFVAKIDSADPTKTPPNSERYYKGITGKFPFVVSVAPALTYFYTKIVEEGRDVERIVIPTTLGQRQSILNRVLALQQNPDLMGNYYFHIRNCATMILALFRDSGFQINFDQIFYRSLLSGIMPKEISRDLRTVLISPFPTFTVPALVKIKTQIDEKYSENFNSVFDERSNLFIPWSAQTLRTLERMSSQELLIVSQNLSYLDFARSKPISAILALRKTRGSERFINFQDLPESFYQVCENSVCADRVVQDLSRMYSKKDLQAFYNRHRSEQNHTKYLALQNFDYQTSIHAKSWRALTESLAATK